MKNNLTAQIIYRSAYIVAACFGLLVSIGFWSIGTGEANPNVNPFFFTDFFNWAIVMSLVATIGALRDNIASARGGETHAYSERYPLLKFCTMSSMLFAFLLGAFFVDRVGAHRLTDSDSFGAFFPGIATPGYWLDLSAFLPRFVLPLAYMIMFALFEPRMKSRSIYSTLGIVPPTIFYFFDLFYGMIMSAVYGGADKLVEAGMYGIAYPYFFQDSAYTFTGWWWIILWPTIFGVSLVILNNAVFFLTRTYRGDDGKLKLDRKTKPAEEELHDCIHAVKIRRAAKKAAK
ncbi:MAG TPA: hypothetical protein H9693_06775 [Firmicutes bacterium]|nr:hypothetical protein [Bacillota bacterium]